MRSSSEIWNTIQELEEDKVKLREICNLLKKIGESLLEYSSRFTKISDLLFDGYNEDGERTDGNLSEYSKEYYVYANEILSLSESIGNVELVKLEQKIQDEKNEYNNALYREREQANKENSKKIKTELKDDNKIYMAR